MGDTTTSTTASKVDDASVLHPYRKRKFFFELAELLGEPPRRCLSRRHRSRREQETELVNGDCARRQSAPPELVDYWDSDQMCEGTPCWLDEERTKCAVHKEPVLCPMLLFCMQVMDEFIAYNTHTRQEAWRVAACRLAQGVFVARWDAQLLGAGSSQEIELQDFLQRKAALVGVAYDVWRIVAAYWDRYKQNYLHNQELYFATTHSDHAGGAQSSKWACMRDYAHIYGLRASQAAQLADATASVERASSFDFLCALLAAIHRQVVSQPEWKIVFNTVVIHLQKWHPGVGVFPCGSFSRGAAYGSTIDVLVALPDAPVRPRTRRAPAVRYEDVVGALATAGIVQTAQEHRMGPTRSLFVMPFKKTALILDLKVFEQPKTWFALVYFTGPQSFVREFFSALLQLSLRELSEPSFDAIYLKATEVLGFERLAAVESEKDVFTLAGREYLLPAYRR
ncbi:hypothetical protein PybrP1_012665 [[Pythium] brassicae (nom. inval.)]|nr:hypothetical protein PybrP1_012665 [[Pythium] brassicae (nom. inval.)]